MLLLTAIYNVMVFVSTCFNFVIIIIMSHLELAFGVSV